jgi:hypothetical protein
MVVFMMAAGLLGFAVSDLAAAASPVMRVGVEEKFVCVYADEHLLLRYRYDKSVSKPYVQQLFSPGGVNILRDAPADHLHHHGLMFAVKVNGVNFWEEGGPCGRQSHNRFADVKVDDDNKMGRAGFTEQVDWLSPDGQELLLKESRTIEVSRISGPRVTLLSWHSKLEAPPAKKSATITGTHYHGLGMRFLKSMDEIGRFKRKAHPLGLVRLHG